MDRVTLRRQLLPILVLLALAAAFIAWSPAAASAGTSLIAPTVAGTSVGSPSSVDAPLAPATVAQTNDPVVRFGEDVVVAAGETYQGLVVFGGDVDVQGTVEGPVVAFGGDVLVAGTVTEEVVAFGGDVQVDGTVTEEIVAFGGRVVLAGTARVGTALAPGEDGVIAFGGEVVEEPGAQVFGNVREISGGDLGSMIGWVVGTGAAEPFRQFFSFGGWVVTTLVFLVLGLVAAALLPTQIRAVGRQLSARPAASLGWGALTFFVVAPLVIVALVISVVGLLVLIPGIPTLLLAYFFAVVSVGTFIAERFVAGRVSDRNQLFLAMTIGVVATSIVSVVPVLGGLLILVMMLFGIGAALMAFGDWRRRRKALAAAALPPGTPVPPGTPLPPGGGVPPYQPAGPAWQAPPAGQPGGWPPQPAPSGGAWPQQPVPPGGTWPQQPTPSEGAWPGEASAATPWAQPGQTAPGVFAGEPVTAPAAAPRAAPGAAPAAVHDAAPTEPSGEAPPVAPESAPEQPGAAGGESDAADVAVGPDRGQTPMDEARLDDAPGDVVEEPATPSP